MSARRQWWRRQWWRWAALCAAVLASPAAAVADDAPAARWIDRPLTLAARAVRIETAIGYQHDERYALAIPGDEVEVDPEGTFFALLGGRFGLSDDVEVGALLVPARVAPDAHYGFALVTREIDMRDPWIALTWRAWARGEHELGARVRGYVPQHQETRGDPRVDLEVLGLLRARSVRFEPALFVGARAGGEHHLEVLGVPLALTVQLGEHAWTAIRTGLYAYDDLEEVAIPLSLTIGATAGRHLDVWLEAEAPRLVRPTESDWSDTDVFTLTANIAATAFP